MGAHAYIEAEDLGLTVLGTIQNSYTVNGVHRQDYDTAVYRAALCRTAALEESLTAYSDLLKTRQKKLDELGEALAALNSAFAQKTKDTKRDDKLSVSSSAVSILRRYGFTASSKMTWPDIMYLQQDVQYAIDKEDNEVQQDMTTLQGFVSKRDDAMQMAGKLVKKVATTRHKGIQYIGS